MTKEIKFRAWNKEEKKIESWDALLNCNSQWFMNLMSGKLKEDYILMQFTGLKDKNGKEIYGGDIIKYLSGRKEIVFFMNGMFGLTQDMKEEKRIFKIDEFEREGIEVIGNKFENPELLK